VILPVRSTPMVLLTMTQSLLRRRCLHWWGGQTSPVFLPSTRQDQKISRNMSGVLPRTSWQFCIIPAFQTQPRKRLQGLIWELWVQFWCLRCYLFFFAVVLPRTLLPACQIQPRRRWQHLESGVVGTAHSGDTHSPVDTFNSSDTQTDPTVGASPLPP
jgi:hypothetical protein